MTRSTVSCYNKMGGRSAPKIIIPHFTIFVKHFLQNFYKKFFPKNFKKTIDFKSKIRYNKGVKKREVVSYELCVYFPCWLSPLWRCGCH